MYWRVAKLKGASLATLSFEGETQQELEAKVRNWLSSVEQARSKPDPQVLFDSIGKVIGTIAKAASVAGESLTGGGGDLGAAVELVKIGFEFGDNAQKVINEGMELIGPVMDSEALRKRVELAKDGLIQELISTIVESGEADRGPKES